MLVADMTKFRALVDELKIPKKYINRVTLKYADYFWDNEKKLKKYSEKEHKRAEKLLNEYKEKMINCENYENCKDDMKMLSIYFAKIEIYLHLKNKNGL